MDPDEIESEEDIEGDNNDNNQVEDQNDAENVVDQPWLMKMLKPMLKLIKQWLIHVDNQAAEDNEECYDSLESEDESFESESDGNVEGDNDYGYDHENENAVEDQISPRGPMVFVENQEVKVVGIAQEVAVSEDESKAQSDSTWSCDDIIKELSLEIIKVVQSQVHVDEWESSMINALVPTEDEAKFTKIKELKDENAHLLSMLAKLRDENEELRLRIKITKEILLSFGNLSLKTWKLTI